MAPESKAVPKPKGEPITTEPRITLDTLRVIRDEHLRVPYNPLVKENLDRATAQFDRQRREYSSGIYYG